MGGRVRRSNDRARANDATRADEEMGDADAARANANANANDATTAPRGEDDQCWICLDGDTADRELYHPCACPRWAHAKCVARWQLQCSGKPEEVTCKFCGSRLPDWRATLFKDVVRASDDAVVPTSTSGSKKRNSMDEHLLRSSADGDDQEAGTPGDEETDHEDGPGEIKGDIIVKFNNISFRCQVRTGPDGLADFMRQIRDRCGIPEEKMKSLNLTYRCKDPNNGMPMTLEGLNESAFDAAVLCSAVQDKIKHQARVDSAVKSSRTTEITSRSNRRRSGDRNSFEEGRREQVSAFRRFE